jgi:hypothetical protein
MLAALKSWQTTITGVLAGISLAAQAVLEVTDAPARLRVAAGLINAAAIAALGILARDNNKTSEQVGAPKASGQLPPAGPPQ